MKDKINANRIIEAQTKVKIEQVNRLLVEVLQFAESYPTKTSFETQGPLDGDMVDQIRERGFQVVSMSNRTSPSWEISW